MDSNRVNYKQKKIEISKMNNQIEQNFVINKVYSNQINGIKSDSNLNKDELIKKLKIENISLKYKNSKLEIIINELRSKLNEVNKIIDINNIINKNKENKNSIYDNQIVKKCNLGIIKSKFILNKIFFYLKRNKFLKIIKRNKNFQKKLDINFKDYKEYNEIYSDIEIEILPALRKYGKFINIDNEKDEASYFHIYFNDNREEVKLYNINKKDKVKKIKIIIDYQIKSFSGLFKNCSCIECIFFNKFKRNNIANMDSMFSWCDSLKELNISNFNTENVNDMSDMFSHCESLEELNLSSFNTKKATDMQYMFHHCDSLKDLNVSSFDTSNVTNMSYMFSKSKSIEELNLSNFNTKNVTTIKGMFSFCNKLNKLNISSFQTNNVINMRGIFAHCYNLEKLDLSNFNTQKVEDISFMFFECHSLQELNISNFIFDSKCLMFSSFSFVSKDIIERVKEQNKSLKDEAFD